MAAGVNEVGMRETPPGPVQPSSAQPRNIVPVKGEPCGESWEMRHERISSYCGLLRKDSAHAQYMS